jgi:hypothetical protein
LETSPRRASTQAHRERSLSDSRTVAAHHHMGAAA